MPTVDELLNASNDVEVCTINPDTREIVVPDKYKLLGVYSDEKVTKIPFSCPKVVGNNVDLSEYTLYINYRNADGGLNAYLVDDVAVSGDNITFSWLLSRHVTVAPGDVIYSLCAKKLSGQTTVTEWNTMTTKGTVVPGLETIEEIIDEYPDVIEQILYRLNALDGQGGGSETLKSVTGATINDSGHLIITLSDNSTIDAGQARGSSGATYQIGAGLKVDSKTNTLFVDTADAVEQDNTKPITSAAVYTEIGNIEVLLAAI